VHIWPVERSKYGRFRKFSGYSGTNRESEKNCSNSLITVRTSLVQSANDARQHFPVVKSDWFYDLQNRCSGEVERLEPASHVIYWPLVVSSAGRLTGFMPCETIESSDI
jgi:hypothetical protein